MNIAIKDCSLILPVENNPLSNFLSLYGPFWYLRYTYVLARYILYQFLQSYILLKIKFKLAYIYFTQLHTQSLYEISLSEN